MLRKCKSPILISTCQEIPISLHKTRSLVFSKAIWAVSLVLAIESLTRRSPSGVPSVTSTTTSTSSHCRPSCFSAHLIQISPSNASLSTKNWRSSISPLCSFSLSTYMTMKNPANKISLRWKIRPSLIKRRSLPDLRKKSSRLAPRTGRNLLSRNRMTTARLTTSFLMTRSSNACRISRA